MGEHAQWTKNAVDMDKASTRIQEQSNTFWEPAGKRIGIMDNAGESSAAFLGAPVEDGPLEHDCVEVIEHTHATRADLKDTPLEQPDQELFTDGSSHVENGTRYAGYAVTTQKGVIKAEALPVGTSAQRAEIVALTRALELSRDQRVNIWTDSKYAFGVVHIHGALWKEQGLLSSQGTNIKYQKEILNLITAVQLPKQVAIMHCKAHQGGDSKIAEGNTLADRTAQQIARQVSNMMALIPTKNFDAAEEYSGLESTLFIGTPSAQYQSRRPGLRP
ncbi:uncharacterized protein LOC128851339 isoform X2 [Cuculus canorus]|uniref:uncharacterized protein LOC128851339 isoform X2 n=1 Tax=Cuculus canorus TaxID=55661 RepID=UPI0023AA97E2|nr:uncharacterized protein LOC128851339 isoform X2 [Cuculus canorus]XP_053915444.1 uncharacterized protein LOC128851339 isoform X2 [Cuculus canorus]